MLFDEVFSSFSLADLALCVPVASSVHFHLYRCRPRLSRSPSPHSEWTSPCLSSQWKSRCSAHIGWTEMPVGHRAAGEEKGNKWEGTPRSASIKHAVTGNSYLRSRCQPLDASAEIPPSFKAESISLKSRPSGSGSITHNYLI
ncbi:hypothetical protein HJG60_011666 [Phyllostomus discolor]|uniref:Uncharacterized protein n=1 Tax=Phyllostomus discolor TaxID=89673 RepID=A0A833ZYG9_9CHIR|nr:hypothetical protein HJG60_011666 [Phyllostomus discolor]